MKVLVPGVAGQLGHDVVNELAKRTRVLARIWQQNTAGLQTAVP